MVFSPCAVLTSVSNGPENTTVIWNTFDVTCCVGVGVAGEVPPPADAEEATGETHMFAGYGSHPAASSSGHVMLSHAVSRSLVLYVSGDIANDKYWSWKNVRLPLSRADVQLTSAAASPAT